MINKKISNLQELEQEQQKISELIDFTGEKLQESVGKNRDAIQHFLIKKVALPTGVASFGVALLTRLLSGKKEKKQPKKLMTVRRRNQALQMTRQGLPILWKWFRKQAG